MDCPTFRSLTPEQVALYSDEKEALFRDLYKNDIRPVKGLIHFYKRWTPQGSPEPSHIAPRANVILRCPGLVRHGSSMLFLMSLCHHGKPNPKFI